MNIRQIAILGGSIVIAIGAVMWMRGQSANNQPLPAVPVVEKKAPAPVMTKVLVSRRDLNVGDIITDGSLGWQDFPNSGLSPSFITEKNMANAPEFYKDAIVRIPMVAGEPITANKIIKPDSPGAGMAAIMNPGMRASSVAITADTGVSGFILPDSRVDVLLTRPLTLQGNGTSVNRTFTSTILENVRVLAIDQNLALQKDQRSVIGATATLELSPQDSERLELADSLGDISLVLRPLSDSTGPTISRADAPAMMQPTLASQAKNNQAQNQVQTKADDPAKNVKIYRGGQ